MTTRTIKTSKGDQRRAQSKVLNAFAAFTKSEKRAWAQGLRIKQKLYRLSLAFLDVEYHFWPPEVCLGEKTSRRRFLLPEKVSSQYGRLLSDMEKTTQEIRGILESEDWKNARSKWLQAFDEAMVAYPDTLGWDTNSGEIEISVGKKPKSKKQ